MGIRVKDHELECIDSVDKYRYEAQKVVINAFNEGYLLGKQHAEKVFKEGDKK